MLKISIFAGDYFGDLGELTRLLDIEGSVTPDDRLPFEAPEEALRLLEMCSEKYATPHLSQRCFTVFIGREIEFKVTPLLRLDGYAHNGRASASVVGIPPICYTEPVTYSPDEDVVEIVRKILTTMVPQ